MTLRKRIGAILLAALLLSPVLLQGASVLAVENPRIVRVGWFESPFNTTDELGRRSGYAYEYQQKISAYTGWVYEYVVASWPELYEMLRDGRIDLLSDVSYTEERAQDMYFSAAPMGAEEYYIFVSPGNSEISLDNMSSFNNKRVGVNRGSVQAGYFRDWAAANGIEYELVELTCRVSESVDMVLRGDIDMLVSLDALGDVRRMTPLAKIGASDFYFAVSKDRPELVPELNSAMSRILSEDHDFNNILSEKYIKTSGMNLYLTGEELSWLDDHGAIRVGYQDNYLAFCASDENGELTGALRDCLRMASTCLENARIDFTAVAYPTAQAALDAVKSGEVDCAFPANLTDYDGETQGFYMTPALMRTDMSAVVREADAESFFRSEHITVAVNAGNTNYDMFLLDHFPEWRSIYFQDTQEGLSAIAAGKVDTLLISNYRFNNISAFCRTHGLTTVSTGVEMDYCFAVSRDSTTLYSILSKITSVIPAASVNSALSYYFTEDAKNSLDDILIQNFVPVLVILVLVVGLLGFLLLRGYRAEKKATAAADLVSATELDALTGLYNKDYFHEYAAQMYKNEPDRQMDAVVINIEQFHAVNAVNGRSFGDRVLRELGEEIHDHLREYPGIACRAESDHFAIYCRHMIHPRELFDKLQSRMNALPASSAIRLRVGVAPYQQGTEPQQLLEQALIACSLARGFFHEHLVVFDDSVRERKSFEHRLVSDLRRAVENREFEIWYQPKFNITGAEPRLCSAEALVRWRHPDLGMVPPGDFIALFERNGQIGAVDKFVWAEAARQIADWRDRYGITLPISVNLSRIDLFDPALESTLEMLIERNGIDRRDMKLEVTESACTENAYHVVDVVERLRKKGYEIEMDDFGSGYSSLSMLSTMPIDVLKMDRAFVSNMEHNPRDAQLVELILDIAKKLRVPVIAEGVESEVQLAMLRAMGCDIVQGFYFSRPLAASEFEEKYLKKNGTKGAEAKS